mgnify:CR=1 FL=1
MASPTWWLPLDTEHYMADNENSDKDSSSKLVICFVFHVFLFSSLFVTHRLFLVSLNHLLAPSFYDIYHEGFGLRWALGVLG